MTSTAPRPLLTPDALYTSVIRTHKTQSAKTHNYAWGDSLADTLVNLDLSLLRMLEDEGLNPRGYHAGAAAYAKAWARVISVIVEEAKPLPEEPWLLSE